MARFGSKARKAQLDAVASQFNGASLRILGQTGEQLAELRFASPAFVPGPDGKMKCAGLAPDESAKAGTASRFQVVTGDGQLVYEGIVGTRAADLVLQDTDIKAGAQVTINSGSIQLPE